MPSPTPTGIRIVLDNGTSVQADATTWVYALISSLPREQVQRVCHRCEEIQAELRSHPLVSAGSLVSRVT